MTLFNTALGIEKPFYDLGHAHNDLFLYTLVSSYYRQLYGDVFLRPNSAEYARATSQYLFEVLS